MAATHDRQFEWEDKIQYYVPLIQNFLRECKETVGDTSPYVDEFLTKVGVYLFLHTPGGSNARDATVRLTQKYAARGIPNVDHHTVLDGVLAMLENDAEKPHGFPKSYTERLEELLDGKQAPDEVMECVNRFYGECITEPYPGFSFDRRPLGRKIG